MSVGVGDFLPFSFDFPPKELVAEKERNGLLTAKMRERINTLEKEHGTFQSKIHVSYQESQQMKMKVKAFPKPFHRKLASLVTPSLGCRVLLAGGVTHLQEGRKIHGSFMA